MASNGSLWSMQSRISIGLVLAILTFTGGFLAKTYMILQHRDEVMQEEIRQISTRLERELGPISIWVAHRDELWKIQAKEAAMLRTLTREDLRLFRGRIDYMERRVERLEEPPDPVGME